MRRRRGGAACDRQFVQSDPVSDGPRRATEGLMRAREAGDIVLVVDDSPDTLRMLTDALEEAGMTVLVALEGAQALAIVGKITPDVILMDAVMPSIDGFETTRRLKRNKTLAHVPVICMTRHAEEQDVLRE